MNKKLMIPVVIILGISLVAAISYYALFSASFTVLPSITLSGVNDCVDDLGEVYDGDIVPGSECTLTNDAPTERNLLISNDAIPEIEVSYQGTLELTEKTVDFTKDVWDIPVDAEKVNVKYTMIGNEFNAEIVGEGIPGYVLIYYPDNDDRFINPSEAWIIGAWELDSLPMEWDYNNGNAEGDYNYCETEEYKTCYGAKIWYVPENVLTENDGSYNIDWSRANEFYFESSLIQFNTNGLITIYPGASLTITPVYEIGAGVTGEQVIETTVA